MNGYQRNFENIVNITNKTVNNPMDKKLFDLMVDVSKMDDSLCIHKRRLMCILCKFYFNNFDVQHGIGNVIRHLTTSGHLKNISNPNKRKSTENLSAICVSSKTALERKQGFNKSLALSFMSADIPFEKLNNEVLHNFLFVYTGENIPDPSTLRKNYASLVYDETLVKVREFIGNDKICDY